MKVEELMIEDYVKFLGRVRKIKSIIKKDTGVEISFEGENPVVVSLDEIEPIPLTPEILEKNGAKHSVYEHPYFDYEPTEDELNDALQYYPFHGYNLGTNIQIAFYPKEIRVEVFGQDFVDMFKIRGRKGDVHVHELQHALRLCGIEKEIEL